MRQRHSDAATGARLEFAQSANSLAHDSMADAIGLEFAQQTPVSNQPSADYDAEGVGFEPTRPERAQQFSRLSP